MRRSELVGPDSGRDNIEGPFRRFQYPWLDET
jgi:hypothetical protein